MDPQASRYERSGFIGIPNRIGGFCDFPVMFSRGQKRDFCGITVGVGRRLSATNQPSGSGTQFLECRGFQTVEVAYTGCRLLKDMLCHFQRRDGLADPESSIRDDRIQRLPHDGNRRCIEFLFQIIHRSQPRLSGCVLGYFCKGMMK
jgi:hypothetical protein